jgi:hypothetical protein
MFVRGPLALEDRHEASAVTVADRHGVRFDTITGDATRPPGI